jgi:autophagy-related protein 33
LLKGVSFSLSTITLPSLLHLPSASLASQSHEYIRTRGAQLRKWLLYVGSGSFYAAYLFSPRRYKHPYLLYVGIISSLAASSKVVDYISSLIAPAAPAGVPPSSKPLSAAERLARRSDEHLGESGVIVGKRGTSSASATASNSSEVDEEEINGEVVRKAVEKQQNEEKVKSGLWGLAFVFGVIGIWGDGA